MTPREEKVKEKISKQLKKDDLAEMLAVVTFMLKDDDFSDNIIEQIEQLFEDFKIDLTETVEYTIRVKATFDEKPALHVAESWVQDAFYRHFHQERCVFPRDAEFSECLEISVEEGHQAQ